MYAATSQYARGDENNQDVNGKIKGYTIFNLDARWNFARGWELFAEVDNLFNDEVQHAWACSDRTSSPGPATRSMRRGSNGP